MGAAVGMTTAPGTTRLALALSLILSILGLYWFAEWASDYAGGAAALALTGLAAGITMPAAARVLGLNRNIAGGIIMALLVAAAWWLSVSFVEFFKQGLPIGGTPGWTGPYYAQGALCVIWLPLVLFAGGDRGPGRRR